MGIEEICSPDLVVIGKARGMTSSTVATLASSQKMGWSRIASYIPETPGQKQALEKRAVYLQSSLCICHTVEVCRGEFVVGPGSDSRYLLSDTFLCFWTRRDLVKKPCHCVCGCIVPSK